MNSSRRKEFDQILESYSSESDYKSHPFVKASQLTKDFDLGDFIMRAVDNVDLNVAEHEYIVIIGESGAGKTTLLHTMAGLLKPTQGTVHLSFIDITPMSEETLTTFRTFNVGIVFQNYNLISSLTAIENVMFPMELCGFTREESLNRSQKLLEKIGLANRKDHLPVQLSAGEQQRVAIARALANDPPIIIADEPTANLDKKNAQFIGNLFESLRQEGKTIIVATHDDNLIEHAHRIIIMENSKITKDERVKDIDYRPSEDTVESDSDAESELM